MGTDIHALVEISHRGEPWRPLKNMGMPQKGPRDYPLFALLGDSRNHSGRHEPRWQEPQTVETPEGQKVEIPGWWYAPDDGGFDRIEPISEPRGVPDDATLIWRAFVAMWEARGASLDVTWLTLEDIVNADWDQVVYSYGVLPEEDYIALRDHGTKPDIHPAAAGGEGVRTVTEIEYAAGERGENMTCISARWKSGTIRETSGNFLDMAKDLAEQIPDGTKLRFMLLFES
jgi:hypothetical protein